MYIAFFLAVLMKTSTSFHAFVGFHVNRNLLDLVDPRSRENLCCLQVPWKIHDTLFDLS